MANVRLQRVLGRLGLSSLIAVPKAAKWRGMVATAVPVTPAPAEPPAPALTGWAAEKAEREAERRSARRAVTHDHHHDDDAELSMPGPAAEKRDAERARIEAIIESPEGRAEPALAKTLAFRTGATAEEAIDILRAPEVRR